ncbi:zinc finger and SCAN domain-containing protein 26 isoform X2 [Dermacentor silvarum]|nr:zinc finger and SCAN domain-containing protein 26 isoform X2 [Dermacentor silvarum]
MVRTYKRKTNRGGWQEEDMRKALESVAQNLHSVRFASRLFRVPKDALCRRAKKLENCCIESLYKAQLGSKRRVLTEEQERMLVDHIVCMEKSLSGLTYKDVQKVVFAFCEANKIAHPFNRINRMAGRDWLYSFMKRHKKDITLQKAEGHSLSRAQSLRRSQVNQFFNRLEATIHDQRLTPGCIFSTDGTSVPNVDFCGQTEEVGKVDGCVQTDVALKRTCEVQTEYSLKTSDAFVNAQGEKSLVESSLPQGALTPLVEDDSMLVCEPAGDAWEDESEDEMTATVLHTVYPCKECGDLFLKEDVLNEHLWQDHKQRSHLSSYKCPRRDELPFECQFCQKGFSQREYLDRHRKEHFDERSRLILQERTLRGEEPFQCQFCKKGFSQREDRDRHLRDHLDGREQSDETVH